MKFFSEQFMSNFESGYNITLRKMALCPTATHDTSSNGRVDCNSDDTYFHQVVFEFIQRIGREVTFYEDYESNISANDFKRIELQIQAQRVEKILNLCIAKIPLIFSLFSLIEQSDHLRLLFSRQDAQKIEQLTQKWSHSMPDTSNGEFIADLNLCLDIVGKHDSVKEWQKVNWKESF